MARPPDVFGNKQHRPAGTSTAQK